MAGKNATGSPQPKDLWIAGPGRDMLLIVGTPLLILPVMLAARGWWPEASILLFIAAFGQLGHNLPGLMRAYGDRALFERYKVRFLVAPVALLVLCVFSILHNLHGLVLVSVIWAIWHALMQTHGFARIYDAKAGSFDNYSRWLDFAVALTWFGGVMVLCDQPASLLLTRFYNCGGPLVPAFLLSFVRYVWLAVMTVATALFVWNVITKYAQRQPVSPVKILLLVTSIAFYWFAYGGARNILVGAAMFEVFHDVQYLTIVWVFNRKRAQTDSGVGAFTRFVFGRSGALVGIYLGMIFAFGGLRYAEQALGSGLMRDGLTGFIAAMGLLHYYYDGFIWKVRESETRKSLGIRGAPALSQVLSTTWFRHAAKWALFIVPFGLLAGSQTLTQLGDFHKWAGLVESFPRDAKARLNYGNELAKRNDHDGAIQQYRRAIELAPTSDKAHLRLGLALRSKGDLRSSERHLRRAAQLRPQNAKIRVQLARTLVSGAKLAEAEVELRTAVVLDPASSSSRVNLGIVLAMSRKHEAAEGLFRKLLEAFPQDSNVHFNLGNVLRDQGKLQGAAHHFRRALELDPRFAEARLQLQRLETES
jgi:tetratricopeptide (TPR) repeat protein